ncbi:DUF3079 domain-containing protein [Coprococcus sp. BIOML-A1]|uniref:DUF3079 domain-containing protein n=1 Tax=Agathobacter rectalis TaxID=39491 RepID=A0A6L5T7B8_9FIRM|nr:DUF3079 domain-containing protein [Agathobacter rectalis]MZK38874.1 DUF3079 domain-containing protein [Coprococcus sp. BIOML-A1]
MHRPHLPCWDVSAYCNTQFLSCGNRTIRQYSFS